MSNGSICGDCMNRFRCIIDSSATVQRCVMYEQQPDFSKLLDTIADKIADKIVERFKGEQHELDKL